MLISWIRGATNAANMQVLDVMAFTGMHRDGMDPIETSIESYSPQILRFEDRRGQIEKDRPLIH